MFASVVIDVASSSVDQFFEYIIPSNLEDIIKVGERVKVPFGKGDKVILGIVVEIYIEKRFFETSKHIIDVLDIEPIISESGLELAYKLKEDCICPLIRILDLMIPDALRLKTLKYLEVNDLMNLDGELAMLFNGKDIIEFNDSLNPYLSKIKKAIKENTLSISYDAKQKTNFKYISKYFVNKEFYYDNVTTLRKVEKQQFLQSIINDDARTLDELVELGMLSIYQIKDLIKKGFFKTFKETVSRIKTHHVDINTLNTSINDNSLTFELKNNVPALYIPESIDEISSSIITLVNKTLLKSKNVLIVCPEILSTINISSLIRKALHVDVACINSNLSNGEYLDYFYAIKNDSYNVIVTSPKGVFSPYSNLGLVLMIDEESENYFNDQSPRYDLHQVLEYITEKEECKLIVESYAPTPETAYKVFTNKYHLVKIATNDRDNYEIINMIDELKIGNTSYISRSLKDALIRTNNKNKNSLLIVNNKNYSSFVLCRECGCVPKCNFCGVSLKYNEKQSQLICPSCGRKNTFNKTCPECNSTNLIYGGCGMESISEEVKNILPDANIKVLSDASIDMLESIYECDDNMIVISSYANSKSLLNIGFDTVGIISFDTTLKNPAFDCFSKAYSMLVTLSKSINKDNKLYIQVSNPNHYVIDAFITGTYKAFIDQELQNRLQLKYSPYYNVNRIIIKAEYDQVFKTANAIKQSLIEIAKSALFIIGPTYSKKLGGVVLIIKHNYKGINTVYKTIYERYMSSNIKVIFDKYPRSL